MNILGITTDPKALRTHRAISTSPAFRKELVKEIMRNPMELPDMDWNDKFYDDVAVEELSASLAAVGFSVPRGLEKPQDVY